LLLLKTSYLLLKFCSGASSAYQSVDVGGCLQGLLQQSFAHQNLPQRGGVPVVSQAAQVTSIWMLAYL
jgi:hypothetical protein